MKDRTSAKALLLEAIEAHKAYAEGKPWMSKPRPICVEVEDLDALLAELDALRADAARLREGFERYEFVRTLTLQRYADIWHASIRGDGPFDSLVDTARAATTQAGQTAEGEKGC